MALAMREWTRRRLGDAESGVPMSLLLQLPCEIAGVRFLVVHATPLEPHATTTASSPDRSGGRWMRSSREVDAEVLVVGHTHLPLLMQHGQVQIVNPGSVEQPLDGDPRAAYALWEGWADSPVPGFL